MSYWNRRREVSQAEWTLYGLVEWTLGAVAAALVASMIREKAVDKAFKSGTAWGQIKMGLDTLQKHFESDKEEETAEEKSEESEEEAE